MAKQLLPDALWAERAERSPPTKRREGGRPRIGSREALVGILFVLYTAIPWERLPFEVAGCSGMTCWRRLRAWQDAGLWDEIHRHMLERLALERLAVAGEIDWSRASIDSSSVAAKKGATRSVRTRPTVASRAPSAISWSTEGVFRSPLS